MATTRGADDPAAHVERNFRSLKTVDLDLRPIHHYTAGQGPRPRPAPCAPAAYLTWHLRRNLAPLTFTMRRRD